MVTKWIGNPVTMQEVLEFSLSVVCAMTKKKILKIKKKNLDKIQQANIRYVFYFLITPA